jgi:hypothetical protein
MYKLCTATWLIILPQILNRGFNDNGDWEGTYEYMRDAAKKKYLKIAEGEEETTGEEGEGKKCWKTAEVEKIKIQAYTLGKKMKSCRRKMRETEGEKEKNAGTMRKEERIKMRGNVEKERRKIIRGKSAKNKNRKTDRKGGGG